MKRSFALALALLAIAAAARPAGASDAAFALQLPGLHHGDEVVAGHGSRWLALVADVHGAMLVDTVLDVHAAHDPLLDAPGEATGLEVQAPTAAAALLYLRGPGLHAGPVAGALDEPIALPAGVAMDFAQPGADGPVLSLSCRARAQLPAQATCVLSASLYEARSEIAHYEAAIAPHGEVAIGDGGGVRVLFAGDLDRDGVIDLVLDLSDHYNLSAPALLLSGEAAPGEVLQLVAVTPVTGC